MIKKILGVFNETVFILSITVVSLIGCQTDKTIQAVIQLLAL